MTAARKKASKAQATMIAAVWSGRDWGGSALRAPLKGYVDPTTKVLIRNGWLKPTGPGVPYPNGDPTVLYVLSDAGIDALECFLSDARLQEGRRCAP